MRCHDAAGLRLGLGRWGHCRRSVWILVSDWVGGGGDSILSLVDSFDANSGLRANSRKASKLHIAIRHVARGAAQAQHASIKRETVGNIQEVEEELTL